MRLVEKEAIKDDPDPKALAAYGMLVRSKAADGRIEEQTWLRFVDGRPVSVITTQLIPSMELPEARCNGQEGFASDLG
jgi:hypothetical protein